ncbi:MAG: tetratricopeptide repeat protein [bacterium]
MKIVRWSRMGIFLAALLWLSALGSYSPAEEQSFYQLRQQGRQALQNWEYSQARNISNELLEKADGEKQEHAARLFRAWYFFYQGDYPAAQEQLEKVPADELGTDRADSLRNRIEVLTDVWKDAPTERSEHFIFRYANPEDKVLAGPALEALEKAYDNLTQDIGVKPEPPILVEAYPTFDDFSAATGLSEEELENSGTIAVCKYRRLMVNSPRILVRGYPYRDTLSHELVHFLIYQRFGDTVPIWLHEGIAKYMELRWREDVGGHLLPSQKSVLASALRMGELISFERMHPSFAKLETPRQGQLAFAEVTTVVDYLVKKGGWPLVFKLCSEMKDMNDWKGAIKRSTGMEFDKFWDDWVQHARSQGYEELPGMEITVYEIRKGEQDFQESDPVEESEVEKGKEYKYARLGDLLRDRGHLHAAIAEYKKAKEIAPYSVKILNKLGLCYYMAEEYESSIEPLQKAIKLVPDYSTSHVNLGRSFYKLEKYDKAKQTFEQVLEINPFNPIPYGYLIKIYKEKGNEDRVETLQQNYKIISG